MIGSKVTLFLHIKFVERLVNPIYKGQKWNPSFIKDSFWKSNERNFSSEMGKNFLAKKNLFLNFRKSLLMNLGKASSAAASCSAY